MILTTMLPLIGAMNDRVLVQPCSHLTFDASTLALAHTHSIVLTNSTTSAVAQAWLRWSWQSLWELVLFIQPRPLLLCTIAHQLCRQLLMILPQLVQAATAVVTVVMVAIMAVESSKHWRLLFVIPGGVI